MLGGLKTRGPLHTFGARQAMGQEAPRAVGYGPLVPKGDLSLPAELDYVRIDEQITPMRDGKPTPGGLRPDGRVPREGSRLSNGDPVPSDFAGMAGFSAGAGRAPLTRSTRRPRWSARSASGWTGCSRTSQGAWRGCSATEPPPAAGAPPSPPRRSGPAAKERVPEGGPQSHNFPGVHGKEAPSPQLAGTFCGRGDAPLRERFSRG
jgi:hypothetical protein